jgi:hypothetical protein
MKTLRQVPWLTPVLIVTQEGEIRRIAVRSLPGQIVQETLSPNIVHKKGLVEWLKVGPEFKPQYCKINK